MDKIEFSERAKMLLEEARNLYRDSGLISVMPFGCSDNGHVLLREEKFREYFPDVKPVDGLYQTTFNGLTVTAIGGNE